MDITKQFSPLYPIRNTLKLLRGCLGFPLTTKNDFYNEFQFHSWLECLRFALYFLIVSLHWLNAHIIVSVQDGTLKPTQNALKLQLIGVDFGGHKGFMTTSKIDRICLLVMFVIGLTSNLSYLVFFQKDAHNLSLVCNQITHLREKLHSATLINYDESSKNGWRIWSDNSQKIVFYGLIFNILGSAWFGITWYFIFQDPLVEDSLVKRYMSGGKIVHSSFFLGVVMLFVLFSPLAMSAELIICRLLRCLGEMFEIWKLLLSHEVFDNLEQIMCPRQINSLRAILKR